MVQQNKLLFTRLVFVLLAALGVILLLCLLWLAGWTEFPPRGWRDLTTSWTHSGLSFALLNAFMEIIFPALLGLFTFFLYPAIKSRIDRFWHEQVASQSNDMQRLQPLPSTTATTTTNVPDLPMLLNEGVQEEPMEELFDTVIVAQEAAIVPSAIPPPIVPADAMIVPSTTPFPVVQAVVGQQPTTDLRVCMSLLGEMKVWLEHDGEEITLPIKSHRRLELLAYISTLAPEREKRISSGRILTDVFEHIAPKADVDNLRGLFQKHTQLLRKEINEVVQAANFPKVKLFQHEKADNSSTKWWLSDECTVVDLSAIRQYYEQMESAKERGVAGKGALKTACDQLIQLYQSYAGDYLEKHLLHYEFGDADWVQVPFSEYRDMYLQALWDAALAEHINSMQHELPEQQRYSNAKRAALLYKTYALHAPKHRQFDLNAKKSKRQSERALRGYLRICRWLIDAQGADEVYSSYERLMAEEFPEWRPNATTIDLLRTVRQLSGENMPLGVLEPPEE